MSDSEEDVEIEKKYYCGMGAVPKNKIRAPPEYCLKHNQVRYYGIVAIDPELLEKYKKKGPNLLTEQIKLKKYEDQGRKLVRDMEKVKTELQDEKTTESRRKRVIKKQNDLYKLRDKLKEQLKYQRETVTLLEQETVRETETIADEETKIGKRN
jgi:hypothetical protein